ncbi:MAG: hypothetical protein WC358_00075 [Ignavibacteria bacterium]|jgi:hypothetical protein
MEKNKLIVKLFIKAKKQKKEIKRIRKLKDDIKRDFIAVGQPLNDNMLKFNKEQTQWCANVFQKIEGI